MIPHEMPQAQPESARLWEDNLDSTTQVPSSDTPPLTKDRLCEASPLYLFVALSKTPHCRFVAVARKRGQQLKEQAQLDGWLRDGSAAYVESLCEWQ